MEFFGKGNPHMTSRHPDPIRRRTVVLATFRAPTAALLLVVAAAVWSRPSSADAEFPADLVLYAVDAVNTAGTWQKIADTSAAGGARMWHPDAGVGKPAAASPTPRDFFELTFQAEAGKAYRLWLRGKAQNNLYTNDSVFVQFSGSVDVGGAPTFRIGSTSSTTVVIENCSGCGLSGWGWQDNEYGGLALGPEIYFAATGPQTLRIQGREDGISIDQVVLSSATYFTTSPGTFKNDSTILAKTAVAQEEAGPVSFTRVRWALVGRFDVAATVDVNGDGRVDVVGVYDNAPLTILSFLNNGDRTFRKVQETELGGGPEWAHPIAVQDFNGDGRKDLVFLDRSYDRIMMMPGRGDGTFDNAITTSFAEQVESFAAADFNGDGILDLVVTEPQTSTAVIHLGDGTGRFSFFSYGRTAAGPGQVVAGDLDNDGRTDVATFSRGVDLVSVLHGDGTGRFRGTRGELFAGFAPRAIALEDLNGDRRTDMAVLTASGVGVFLGADGGGWQSRRDVDTTRTWTGFGIDRSLTLADVNGDSIPDIVTGHVHNPGQGQGVWNSAAILYGDGAGNFGAPEEFSTSGSAPLRVADLDTDARADILDPSSGTVFWGAPFAPNSPPTADAGPDVTIGETQQATLALWSRSTDPDEHLLTYSWTDRTGEEISRGPRVLPFQYVRQPPGTYTFTLTVDDLHGERRSDPVTVTLLSEQTGTNTAPVAAARASQEGVWGYEQQFQDMPDPNTYLFSESTDPDGDALGYEWRDSAGTIVSTAGAWNAQLPPGTHSFTLFVRDGHGGESQDTVTVTVRPFEEIVMVTGYKEGVRGTQWERVEEGEGSTYAVSIRDADTGAPKVNAPLAAPSSYVDITFPADPTLEYKLWIRMKAEDDHWANDSIWVQFTGSTDAAGNPAWRTGTSSGLWVNLEECSGCGLSGWGWRDDAWGTAGAMSGTVVRFPQGGLQTIRIQTREDGAFVNEIVLSARKYKTTRPGAVKNDATVLPFTAFWGS
jgi:hypothetical protein